MSAHPQRILFLDGWRGMAILTVLIGHFFPGLESLGALGVDLFFVLSGRLMAQILIEEQYPLNQFFLRRLSRIYPTLLLFATTMLAVSMLARWRGIHSNSLISPIDYIAAISMWMNYKAVFIGEAGLLNHIWSISIEEHSYIILALLSVAIGRKRWILYITSIIAALALLRGGLLSLHPDLTDHQIIWRTEVRLAPLFLSFSCFLLPLSFRSKMAHLVVPALLSAFILALLPISPMAKIVANSVLLSVAVNGLDYSSAGVRKFFELSPMRFCGVISFSIYLWQQPFFVAHEKVNPAILLLGCFVTAVGSFYLIEQPSRRFLNALMKGKFRADLETPKSSDGIPSSTPIAS